MNKQKIKVREINPNLWIAIFLVLILVVAIIWYKEDKTQISIYKEECKNTTDYNFICSDGSVHVGFFVSEDISSITLGNISCERKELGIDSCDFKEMDYLVYPKKDGTRDCKCVKRKIWNGVEFGCEVYDESSCVYYQHYAIEKDKITKEFLDENCDRLACYPHSEYKNYNCIIKQYQCGDYIVELKE